MLKSRSNIFVILAFTLLSAMLQASTDAHAAGRQGDRFGIRIGAWPQNDISGTLNFLYFNAPAQTGTDTLYEAIVEEDGHILPFIELYGLFNVSGMWWIELGAGFTQRTNIEVAGLQRLPDPGPINPKDDSSGAKILLGLGRVDFLPLFLGARAVKEVGTQERPHNLYGRGGLSMLIASEEPSVLYPHQAVKSTYHVGTKAALGFLIGGGGEYYLNRRFGLAADIAYRMSDLNYADGGDFDLSGLWISAGVTIRVR